jgi:potassium voltage-gated channel Shal-related subfamily D member 2
MTSKLYRDTYFTTAISTVGYGEMTPRSFLGRLITLPLLLCGLLLIALPSFVLGREFSVVWNEMTSGPSPRTPYMQSGNAFGQSEPVRSHISVPSGLVPNRLDRT